MMANCGRL